MNTLYKIDELNKFSQENPLEYVLKGLVKGKIGMLVSRPEAGKSLLTASLACEVATSSELIGLKVGEPKKVLYVLSEDPAQILCEKINGVKEVLSKKDNSLLQDNLQILVLEEPLFESPRNANNYEYNIKNERIYVNLFSQYDFIIIDTLSEAIGSCDEVEDQQFIKNSLQRLAAQSNASMLLVHHIKKSDMLKNSTVSMASSSGLTGLMRNTKFMLTINKESENDFEVSYLKGNYIKDTDKSSIELFNKNNCLLNKQLYADKKQKKTTYRKKKEPKEVYIKGVDPEILNNDMFD